MPKLLRNRWLRWSVFVGSLVALGVGIYQIQPPEPMCEIEGDLEGGVIDGVGLVTSRSQKRVLHNVNAIPAGEAAAYFYWPGPMKIWDPRTGSAIASYFNDKSKLGWKVGLKNNRFFVVEVIEIERKGETNVIHLASLAFIDLVNGKAIDIPLKESFFESRLIPSTDDGLVARMSRPSAQQDWMSQTVYDPATGRVVFRRDGAGRIVDFSDTSLTLFAPDKHALEYWDLNTGKLNAKLDNVDKPFSVVPGTPYFIARLKAPKDRKTVDWVVWNRVTQRIEGEIQADNIWFAADCKRLVACRSVDDKHTLELRELPTCRLVGQMPVDGVPEQIITAGRFLVVYAPKSKSYLKMVEIPSMKMLWQLGECSIMYFSHDAKTFFVNESDPRADVAYDCETGQTRIRFNMESSGPGESGTYDARSLILQHEHEQMVLVYNFLRRMGMRIRTPTKPFISILDTESCRVRFQMLGDDVHSAFLSKDNRTLLTRHVIDEGKQHSRTILRCWDVDAWKPLRWAIGVPAGLAALGVLFTWWRRRRAMVKNAAAGKLKLGDDATKQPG